jgi:hypothetical protein
MDAGRDPSLGTAVELGFALGRDHGQVLSRGLCVSPKDCSSSSGELSSGVPCSKEMGMMGMMGRRLWEGLAFVYRLAWAIPCAYTPVSFKLPNPCTCMWITFICVFTYEFNFFFCSNGA